MCSKCVDTCVLRRIPSVVARNLCASPFRVGCDNSGAILTAWCASQSPYFAEDGSTPACYASVIGACVKQCSASNNVFRLQVPAGGVVVTPTAVNVLSPQDLIFASSLNSTTGNTVANVLDGNPRTKYVNTITTDAGFTIVPASGYSLLSKIAITSALDFPERDPLSIVIEAANDPFSTNFQIIVSMWLPFFLRRGTRYEIPLPPLSTPNIPHNIYRIRFPSVTNVPVAADAVQIADLELLGLACLVDDMALPSGVSTTCTGAVFVGTACPVICAGELCFVLFCWNWMYWAGAEEERERETTLFFLMLLLLVVCIHVVAVVNAQPLSL